MILLRPGRQRCGAGNLVVWINARTRFYITKKWLEGSRGKHNFSVHCALWPLTLPSFFPL